MPQTAESFFLAFAQGREPDSDEPEMESSLHYDQLALLVSTLEWHWRDRDDFFIGADLSVYFRRDQFGPRELRGPDFFLVRGVERRPRRSWTVWLEDGRYPDLIIELLSDETAGIDRTRKKALYEHVFRTPEYFWFSPQTGELAGFHLVDARYYPIDPDPAGRLPSVIMGLRLGVSRGLLRFYTREGELVPTLAESVAAEQARAELERRRADEESARAAAESARAEEASVLAMKAVARADAERVRADQAQARADVERHQAAQERLQAEAQRGRADRLAERLRALGVDPDAAGRD